MSNEARAEYLRNGALNRIVSKLGYTEYVMESTK